MWLSAVALCTPILWSTIGAILSRNLNVEQNEDEGIRNYAAMKYSEIERNALLQFRGMVEDVLERDYEHKDQFLIRWIRTCSMDLGKAEAMLRKAQKWRKDNNIDTILQENLLDIKSEFCRNQGVAYDGSPVMVSDMGSLDVRRIIMAGQVVNLTRKFVQCLERLVVKLRDMSETTGKDIGQAVSIINMAGYSTKIHACPKCISFYLDSLIDTQNYYPEYLKLTVVVNAPRAAKPLYELSKPLMNAATLKSMKLFGTDKKEFSEFLLKYIPSSQFSKQFGGTGGIGW